MKYSYNYSRKKNGRYINPFVEDTKRTIKDIFKWKMGYFKEKKDLLIPPKDFEYPTHAHDVDLSEPYVLWINHSTFLIHVEGLHFLTDPIWNGCCSPIPFVGLKRQHSPGLLIEDLPKIDYILISHDHYDHLDKKSVIKLHQKFPHINWIVPKGVKKWMNKRSIKRVIELDWFEDVSYNTSSGLSIQIYATPAQHFSGRVYVNANKTLWVGYVVEIKKNEKLLKRFYFSGDTGYNPYDFKRIGRKWNKMDLSMIPIGTYEPRDFMRPVHVNPQEAVTIHKEVGSRFSVGMHWKTFRLSDEPMNLPPYGLYMAMKENHLNPKDFVALEPGVYVNF